jgi:alkylhydroperoxidase/carboxymuconolactone decarboxylase family protein YurZ
MREASEGFGEGLDEGLDEWALLSESLIRGLVHALNNRLTALSAFAELAALGDEEFAPATILPAELVRLHRVSAHFRLLLSEETPAEALEVGALLDDVLALHEHLPRVRTVRCEVVRQGAPTPVRVSRWRMLRLLLVLIESGTRVAEARGQERIELHLAPFDDGLLLQVEAAEVTPYARTLAAHCSATIEIEAGRATVRLPSLAALRRRERAAAQPDGRRS